MNKQAKTAFISAIVLMLALGVVFVMAAKPSARGVKQCNDGLDNDGDSYTDFPSDPGCSSKTDNNERNVNIECDDGVDNDNDGNVDMNDAGCVNPSDDDETNCGDGVCEGGETSGNCPADCGVPDSCNDTDGGNFPLVFGATSGYLNNNWYSNDDYCVDSSNINEYYCSGTSEQSQQQSCGTDGYGSGYCVGNLVYKDYTDYFCANGGCDSNQTAEFQEDCDFFDNYGPNYCNGTSVYRDYTDYWCNGGSCGHGFPTPQLVENCAYGCTGGSCDDVPDSCNDTDGGNFPFLFGTTSGFLNSSPYSHNDYCVDSSNINEYYCSGTSEQSQQQSCGTDGYGANYCIDSSIYRDLTDYYCSGGECDSSVTPEFVQSCTYGCTNGTCNPIPNSCSDSDGGIVFTVNGTVSGYKSEQWYNYADYCTNSETVMEYYCVSNLAYNFTSSCVGNTTSSCVGGKCV